MSEQSPTEAGPKRRIRWDQVLCGFIFGVLTWLCAERVGISAFPAFRFANTYLVFGVLCALLMPTRAGKALWVFAGLVVGLLLVVGYTPLVRGPAQGLVVSDTLHPVEAVVVLSSDINSDGTLTDAAQTRVLQAYQVLHAGMARELLLTRLEDRRSYIPAVQEQMRSLGLDYPVEEPEGRVANTHDEAVVVSQMARERGWKEVILVSDPTHMRRAKAVFEKAGLPVLCSPGSARDYDLAGLYAVGDRLHAFRDWVYEVVGYEYYRFRGWI